jgi:DDE_Tnp_1-associated
VIASNCPLRLSSLVGVSRDDLSAAAAADGPARPCLRAWLASVPDPRSLPGRRHPLEFVLALAVCTFTAAGNDSPSAIADRAADCSQETLAALGGRRDPWARLVRPPCERTFRRVFSKVDKAASYQTSLGVRLAPQPFHLSGVPESAGSIPCRVGNHV